MNRQGFLKGSAILLVSVFITKALGLIYRIPLTRLLGGTGMGYFAGAFCVFTPVMAVSAAGIPSAMARLAAENYAFERYENLRRVKRIAVMFFTAQGLVFTALLMLVSMPAARLFTGEHSTGLALMTLAPSLLFCSVMSVERGYYEGLHNMYPTAVSEIIETVFRLVLGLGLAYGVKNYAMEQFAQSGSCFGVQCPNENAAMEAALPFVAAAAVLGTSLSSGIACLYIIIRSKAKGDGITAEMRQKDKTVDPVGQTIRALLSYSLPVALTALITTLTGMIDMLTLAKGVQRAYSQSPEVFSGFLEGGVTAKALPNFIYGSYTALAVTVSGLVPTFTAMLGKSSLAAVTEGAARGSSRAVGDSINKMLTLCAYIAFPAGMLISLFPREILSILFSGRNAEIAAATPALKILGTEVVLVGLSLPCFTLLHALKKPGTVTAIMLIGGGVKLAGNLLLIHRPPLALTGAAASTVLSELFICAACLHSTYKAAGAPCDVKNVFIKPAYAAFIGALGALLAQGALKKHHIFAFGNPYIGLLSIIFSVIMYLIAAVLLCETPKSARIIRICKKNRKNT